MRVGLGRLYCLCQCPPSASTKSMATNPNEFTLMSPLCLRLLRERDRQRDRQTDREIDRRRLTDRQTETETDRQSPTYKFVCFQNDRHIWVLIWFRRGFYCFLHGPRINASGKKRKKEIIPSSLVRSSWSVPRIQKKSWRKKLDSLVLHTRLGLLA